MKPNIFGTKFREARTAAGKTLGDTARHLALATTYLSDVERATRPPLTAERIRSACQWFGIDPSMLLSAAAQQQGDFRLPAQGLSNKGMHAMAALQRGLSESEFDDDFFEQLLRLAERKKV